MGKSSLPSRYANVDGSSLPSSYANFDGCSLPSPLVGPDGESGPFHFAKDKYGRYLSFTKNTRIISSLCVLPSFSGAFILEKI